MTFDPNAANTPTFDPSTFGGFKLVSTDGVVSGVGAPNAGQLNLTRLMVPTTTTITSTTWSVAAGGVTLANSFVAVYGSDGARLGVSADQSTNWTTAGEKLIPLTSPIVVTGGPGVFIWVAILVGSAGTLPTFAQASSNTAALNAGTSNATARSGNVGNALTAPPATFNPSTIVKTFTLKFVAIS